MGYGAIQAKRILQDKLSKLKLSFAGSTPKSPEIEKMEPANCNSRNGQLYRRPSMSKPYWIRTLHFAPAFVSRTLRQ